MIDASGKRFLEVWDELQFGLLAHRAVADTMGYSVDLALGFDARARDALGRLADDHAAEMKRDAARRRQLLLADGRRRSAVLEAYLDPGAPHARDRFTEAMEAYRGAVHIGDGGTLPDEFSRVLTGLECTLTLRCIGQLDDGDQNADRSERNLASLGLLHLVDELRADAVKARVHLAAPSELVPVDAPTGRTISGRERAHLWLANGLAHLHNGDRRQAELAVRRSSEELVAAHYGVFDQMERHFDLLITSWVLGMTATDPGEQVAALDQAVRRVEEVRGGWQYGSSASDPTWRPLQAVLESSLETMCSLTHPDAGWHALRFMEAARRRHLAGMLRSVRFDASDSDRVRRSVVVALGDLVALSEDQELRTAGMPGVLEASGVTINAFDRDDAGVAHSTSVVPAGLDDNLRTELKHRVSDYFADAFLPEHVEIDQLRAATVGWHVVAYTRVGATTMARAWVTPDGTAAADIVDVDGCAARAEELDWRGSGYPFDIVEEALGRPLMFVTEDLAEVLSSRMLPGAMRDALPADAAQGLIVVPDDWLASVAWPALTDTNRRELIRSVDIAVVPSISLLREPGEWDGGAGGGVAACLDYADAAEWRTLDVAEERRYFAGIGVDASDNIGEMLDALVRAPDSSGWAYLACHGEDPAVHRSSPGTSVVAGMGIELIERDESHVTFLDLLAVPWPRLVAAAGCFTARLNWTVGSGLAPLGLAVSALARGADVVVGSTHQLDNRSSGLLIGWQAPTRSDLGLLPRVFSGTHPVRALAAAQRAWLERGGGWAAPYLWARAVAITQRLPTA